MKLESLPKDWQAQARAQLEKPPPPSKRKGRRSIERIIIDGLGEWHAVEVVPMGAPRQTRRDKWNPSPAVKRYRAFKDAFRGAMEGLAPENPVSVSWRAYLPIPKSWTKKKKEAMAGKHHRQKPDRDNIDKAILDSLYGEDCGIAEGSIAKFWDDGKGPRIEIRFG